jgi:pimeloyl-ACP methyl ester carboxylesterase
VHLLITLLVGLTCLVLIFTSATYAARAWSLRQIASCDEEPALGWIAGVAAFVTELVASLAVLALIPIGWMTSRHDTQVRPRGGVVLVHGWSLNRGCWWVIRRRLARDGFGPIYSFEYPSLSADVEAAAEKLKAFLDTLGPQTTPLALIGHSLGGLVIRYVARRHRIPNVRRLVTLGSPHGGTLLAAPRSPWQKRLAPGSPLINQLNALDRVPFQYDVIALYSTFDAMVLPWTNARYPEAFNVQVSGIGHNALLFSKRFYILLSENLAAPMR